MSATITWFVFAKDSYTDRAISDFIEAGTFGFESETTRVLCEDGESRGMWRMSWQKVKQLWDSRTDLGLKLEIFNQRGSGKVRNVTLIFTNNFKRGKELIKKIRSQKKLF